MNILFSNYSYLYSFYADYEAYDSAIVLDTLSVNFKAYFQVYCLRVQDYCCFLFISFLYIFEYGRVIYIYDITYIGTYTILQCILAFASFSIAAIFRQNCLIKGQKPLPMFIIGKSMIGKKGKFQT